VLLFVTDTCCLFILRYGIPQYKFHGGICSDVVDLLFFVHSVFRFLQFLPLPIHSTIPVRPDHSPLFCRCSTFCSFPVVLLFVDSVVLFSVFTVFCCCSDHIRFTVTCSLLRWHWYLIHIVHSVRPLRWYHLPLFGIPTFVRWVFILGYRPLFTLRSVLIPTFIRCYRLIGDLYVRYRFVLTCSFCSFICCSNSFDTLFYYTFITTFAILTFYLILRWSLLFSILMLMPFHSLHFVRCICSHSHDTSFIWKFAILFVIRRRPLRPTICSMIHSTHWYNSRYGVVDHDTICLFLLHILRPYDVVPFVLHLFICSILIHSYHSTTPRWWRYSRSLPTHSIVHVILHRYIRYIPYRYTIRLRFVHILRCCSTDHTYTIVSHWLCDLLLFHICSFVVNRCLFCSIRYRFHVRSTVYRCVVPIRSTTVTTVPRCSVVVVSFVPHYRAFLRTTILPTYHLRWWYHSTWKFPVFVIYSPKFYIPHSCIPFDWWWWLHWKVCSVGISFIHSSYDTVLFLISIWSFIVVVPLHLFVLFHCGDFVPFPLPPFILFIPIRYILFICSVVHLRSMFVFYRCSFVFTMIRCSITIPYHILLTFYDHWYISHFISHSIVDPLLPVPGYIRHSFYIPHHLHSRYHWYSIVPFDDTGLVRWLHSTIPFWHLPFAFPTDPIRHSFIQFRYLLWWKKLIHLFICPLPTMPDLPLFPSPPTDSSLLIHSYILIDHSTSTFDSIIPWYCCCSILPVIPVTGDCYWFLHSFLPFLPMRFISTIRLHSILNYIYSPTYIYSIRYRYSLFPYDSDHSFIYDHSTICSLLMFLLPPTTTFTTTILITIVPFDLLPFLPGIRLLFIHYCSVMMFIDDTDGCSLPPPLMHSVHLFSCSFDTILTDAVLQTISFLMMMFRYLFDTWSPFGILMFSLLLHSVLRVLRYRMIPRCSDRWHCYSTILPFIHLFYNSIWSFTTVHSRSLFIMMFILSILFDGLFDDGSAFILTFAVLFILISDDTFTWWFRCSFSMILMPFSFDSIHSHHWLDTVLFYIRTIPIHHSTFYHLIPFWFYHSTDTIPDGILPFLWVHSYVIPIRYIPITYLRLLPTFPFIPRFDLLLFYHSFDVVVQSIIPIHHRPFVRFLLLLTDAITVDHSTIRCYSHSYHRFDTFLVVPVPTVVITFDVRYILIPRYVDLPVYSVCYHSHFGLLFCWCSDRFDTMITLFHLPTLRPCLLMLLRYLTFYTTFSVHFTFVRYSRFCSTILLPISYVLVFYSMHSGVLRVHCWWVRFYRILIHFHLLFIPVVLLFYIHSFVTLFVLLQPVCLLMEVMPFYRIYISLPLMFLFDDGLHFVTIQSGTTTYHHLHSLLRYIHHSWCHLFITIPILRCTFIPFCCYDAFSAHSTISIRPPLIPDHCYSFFDIHLLMPLPWWWYIRYLFCLMHSFLFWWCTIPPLTKKNCSLPFYHLFILHFDDDDVDDVTMLPLHFVLMSSYDTYDSHYTLFWHFCWYHYYVYFLPFILRVRPFGDLIPDTHFLIPIRYSYCPFGILIHSSVVVWWYHSIPFVELRCLPDTMTFSDSYSIHSCSTILHS